MSVRRRLAAVEAPGPENGRPAARLPADVRQAIRALLARMLVEDYKQNPSVNQQVLEPRVESPEGSNPAPEGRS